MSFYHKYRCGALVLVCYDDFLIAGHAHQDAGENAVEHIEPGHVDERMPGAVAPCKVDIFGHMLFAVLLADITGVVQIGRDRNVNECRDKHLEEIVQTRIHFMQHQGETAELKEKYKNLKFPTVEIAK